MDVSNHGSIEAQIEAQEEKGGPELLNQLVSLTGLPENLVHQELSDILRLSGKDSAELTLEHLREAMLKYLEAMDSAQAEGGLIEEPLG